MKDFVFDLIKNEEKRQREGLELIPSENYVSAPVLEAMGSVLTNKYSEGYPSFLWDFSSEEKSERKEPSSNAKSGTRPDFALDEDWIAETVLPNHRYYGGQENVDRIERLAVSRACRLFGADHANVQPHSGANANEAVYFAWCEPGDTILAMNLAHGGHLTHGSPVTRSAKIYRFVAYGVNAEGDIDYDEMEKVALEELPRLILVGYSAFMKLPDFQRVKKIAEKVEEKANKLAREGKLSEVVGERGQDFDGEAKRFEVLLMADMAHVAGLIAGGVHPNPLEYGFNVMTTTTHKTLRGPRGGLILSKGLVGSPLKKPELKLENIPTLIDRAVFPGTQGGPLEHIIAAKAVAFGEALQPEFKDYAARIVENAKTLADELKARGFVLQGDGTENHLILVNVDASFDLNGKDYEKALDKVGLTLNANALPGDKQAAFRPSGVRLGTPAMTTRGLGVAEMKRVAGWMAAVAEICQAALADGKVKFSEADNEKLAKIREEVRELALKFPLPNEVKR